MLELVQGSTIERAARLTVGSAFTLSQDSDGLPVLDVNPAVALTQAAADARYLKLAADNDPLTAPLSIGSNVHTLFGGSATNNAHLLVEIGTRIARLDSNSFVSLYRLNTSWTTPTGLASGNILGGMYWQGSLGTNAGAGVISAGTAAIEAYATEAWSQTSGTGTNAGTELRFYTTPNVTITRTLALTLQQSQWAVFASGATFASYITASAGVFGTDPGGGETLRGQTLRAGATVLTSTLAVTGQTSLGGSPPTHATAPLLVGGAGAVQAILQRSDGVGGRTDISTNNSVGAITLRNSAGTAFISILNAGSNWLAGVGANDWEIKTDNTTRVTIGSTGGIGAGNVLFTGALSGITTATGNNFVATGSLAAHGASRATLTHATSTTTLYVHGADASTIGAFNINGVSSNGSINTNLMQLNNSSVAFAAPLLYVAGNGQITTNSAGYLLLTPSSGITYLRATGTNAINIGDASANPISIGAGGGGVTISSALGINAGANLGSGQTLGLAGGIVSGSPTWSSAQAITLSTAAQPNITSLGTLTGLTVNGGAAIQGQLSIGTGAGPASIASDATYLYLRGANGSNASAWSNGTSYVYSVLSLSSSLYIAAAQSIYFDGGTHTRIYESTDNVLDFVVGGTLIQRNTTTQNIMYGNVLITATNRLYLDGGSNSYFHESSGDVVRVVVGGSDAMGWETIGTWVELDLRLGATRKLRLDGSFSGDTYIWEVASNQINFVAGGVTPFAITTSSLIMQPTHKLYLDGGNNTYLHEYSGDSVSLIAGGSTAWFATPNGVGVVEGQKLYLSGGGAVYWLSAAYYDAQLWVNTNLLAQFGWASVAWKAGLVMTFWDSSNTASSSMQYGASAGGDHGVQFNQSIIMASNWIRFAGTTGVYWQAYGGGWNMTGSTYIEAYGNKKILANDYERTSDVRLKNSLVPIDNALDRLRRVGGYTGYYNDQQTMPGRKSFLVAQEWQKVLPEAVGQDSHGNLLLSYDSAIPLIIEAVKQESYERIEDVRQLRRENEELKRRVSELEARH